MSGDVDMRPRKTMLDRLYSTVWHIITNRPDYTTTLELLYAWSMTRTFRFVLFIQALYSGKKQTSRCCEALHEIESNALDHEKLSNSSEINKDDHRQLDKGLLEVKGSILFRLEVILAFDPVCETEIYQLLTNDEADVDKLGSRVFYKTYYDAKQSHGALQLALFIASLREISCCHASIRSLSRRCSIPVTWSEHHLTLQRIYANLQPQDDTTARVERGKHWGSIGFQGADPSTDFRGVGELGLHHLDYFCAHHPVYARRMIEESRTNAPDGDVEELPWYPLALCSIHVTKFLCDLLRHGIMERSLIQAQLSKGVAKFTDDFFSFLFVRCHMDWAEGVDKCEITSVVQFEAFFQEFSAFMLLSLERGQWSNDDFHPRAKWW